MHTHHKTLLAEILSNQRKGRDAFGVSYLRSGHRYYGLTAPELRGAAKAWLAANKLLPPKAIVKVLDSLFLAESHEEKILAAVMLGYSKAARGAVTTKTLDAWLDHLVGWAEIDALCSNVFKPDEVLASWKEWERFLKRLSRDGNINKRRAALVFLTGPVRYTSDKRLSTLAFETVERLKGEREIIITKAVSWLLRNLTIQHRQAVASYIAKNKATLPAIAVRETTRKIKTGRK
jgi:3-methyladenine DNA glycosylase AlkD